MTYRRVLERIKKNINVCFQNFFPIWMKHITYLLFGPKAYILTYSECFLYFCRNLLFVTFVQKTIFEIKLYSVVSLTSNNKKEKE